MLHITAVLHGSTVGKFDSNICIQWLYHLKRIWLFGTLWGSVIIMAPVSLSKFMNTMPSIEEIDRRSVRFVKFLSSFSKTIKS